MNSKVLQILICLSILVFFNCNNRHKTFKIKGNIKEVKNGAKVKLYNYHRELVVDSTKMINGFFEFNGELDYPYEAALFIDDENLLMSLWVEDGEIIINSSKKNIIKNNIDAIKIKSDLINPLVENYNKYIEPFQSKKSDIYQKMRIGQANEEDFKRQIDIIYKKTYEFFIREENINNYFAITKILNYKDGIERKKLSFFYDKLNFEYKISPNGKILNNYLKADFTKEGDYAYNFTAFSTDSKKYKLSDFKSKYILLDFWASWCTPCIKKIEKEFPLINKKFDNKNFQIISYSFDTNKEDWINKSRELNIDWINLSNNVRMAKSKTAFNFNIEEIPTSFIISPEGKILKRISYHENINIE